MTRTQTVLSSDGTVEIIFRADRTSGSTNKEVEIKYSSDDAATEMAGILTSFDNGITEKNVEKFMSGGYSGEANAPLIGLKDAEIASEGLSIRVRLTKNDAPEGEVPFWDGTAVGGDVGAATGSEKISGNMAEAGPILERMFTGTEFATTTMTKSAADGYRVVTNEKGEIIESSSGFTAEFESTAGTKYKVGVEADETGKKRLAIDAETAAPESAERVRFIAACVWSEFYEGSVFDQIDLASGTWENDRMKVEMKDSGYRILLG